MRLREIDDVFFRFVIVQVEQITYILLVADCAKDTKYIEIFYMKSIHAIHVGIIIQFYSFSILIGR